MPVIYDTVPIFPVQRDTAIAKYLDLTKFLSLLTKESLFFCRLDKLEDQFEGTTANQNYDLRIRYHKQLRDANFFPNPPTDEEIIKSIDELYEFENKLKPLTCVNCWNKYERESAALWKIYSDYGKGIMIKTSAGRLEDSLVNTVEEIYLSEVKYIDFESQIMPDGNTTYPIIHKNDSYSYESEVRLFHQVASDMNWVHDWTKEEVQEGKYFKVDTHALIEEIIVGPFSPKWFTEIVIRLNENFGLNKPVKKSKLSK